MRNKLKVPICYEFQQKDELFHTVLFTSRGAVGCVDHPRPAVVREYVLSEFGRTCCACITYYAHTVRKIRSGQEYDSMAFTARADRVIQLRTAMKCGKKYRRWRKLHAREMQNVAATRVVDIRNLRERATFPDLLCAELLTRGHNVTSVSGLEKPADVETAILVTLGSRLPPVRLQLALVRRSKRNYEEWKILTGGKAVTAGYDAKYDDANEMIGLAADLCENLAFGVTLAAANKEATREACVPADR